MRIANDHTLEISLLNQDVTTFRRIIELAICRLQTSPMQQMIGSPLHVQDGIKGRELIDVKDMLTTFAGEFDLGEPALEPAAPQLGAEPAAQQATEGAQTTDASDDDIPPEVRAILGALGDLPITGFTVMRLQRKN